MIYVYWTLFSIIIAWLASLFMKKKVIGNNDETIPTEAYKPGWLSESLLLISFLPFFLLGALRYFVGTDYETYINNQIPAVLGNGWAGNVAPLYRLIIVMGSKLGSTQWIFVLTSLLVAIFMYLPILKESKSYSLSVFLVTFSTFFSFTLNGMRQSIAALVVIFGFSFISEHKNIFFICCVAGVLFHTSAILLVIIALLGILLKYRVPTRIFVILIPFIYILAPIIYTFIKFIAGKIGYSYYFEVNAYVTFDKALVLTLLISLLVASVVEIQGTKLREYDQILLNITGIGMLMLIFLRTVPNAGRLVELFLPIEFILLPNLISYIKGRDLRIIIRITLIILFIVLFIIRVLYKNYNGTLPYQFVTDWNF